MSIPIDCKRKREEDFFEPNKMRKTEIKIDLNPLFFTIYSELENVQEDASAYKIADLLSQNPEIFHPFHHTPYKQIKTALNDFAIGLDLDQPTKAKFKTIATQLYRYTLKNSSINQLLPSRNAELDAFQKLLDHNLQAQVHQVQRRARALSRELRSIGIDQLDIHQIPDYLSRLHQLTTAFAPILELKKCTDGDENARLKDLARALKQEEADAQFPRILSDYPQIVGKIQELAPLFRSISATLKTINNFQVALQRRYADLAKPARLSHVEEQILIPFGDLFYRAAAEHFWKALNETSDRRRDPDFESLIESDSLPPSIPAEVDYLYLNRVWGLYFAGPELEQSDFDEWLHQVLLRVEQGHLNAVCEALQGLTKIVNSISEDPSLSKLEREVLISPHRHEMEGRVDELLGNSLFANQRTLADIKAFLLDCLK